MKQKKDNKGNPFVHTQFYTSDEFGEICKRRRAERKVIPVKKHKKIEKAAMNDDW